MNNKDNHLVVISTAKISHGRLYKKEYEFDLVNYHCKPMSWLAMVVKGLSKRSLTQPLPTPEIGYFRSLIDKLRNDLVCREIYTSNPKTITRKEVNTLFRQMENCLEVAFDWKPATKAKASSYFRKKMIDSLPMDAFGEDLQRHRISFRTNLTGRYQSRSILSGHNLSPDFPHPIDALPHKSIRDLKSQVIQRLDFDAKKLISASISELKFWADTRAKLFKLSELKYSDEEKRVAVNFLQRGIGKDKDKEISKSIHPIRLVGACALQCQSLQRMKTIRSASNDYGSSLLVEVLDFPSDRSKQVPYMQVIQMPLRSHYHELAAAFILLLAHTAWNSASLRQLTTNSIKKTEKGFILQAYKSKTGQHTPEVYLDSSIVGVKQAIELLLWNNFQLRKHQFIAPDDTNVWYAWPSSVSGFQTVTIGDPIRAARQIANRYNLAPFSMDQIRSHMLVRIALKHGTPEAARVVAGHSSINITGHYLDQFLTRLLSKSINLEFQRKLEEKINFLTSKSIKEKETTLHSNLLKPVGDGSVCVDPESPPFEEWINGSMCNAMNCHVGNGCPNNKIEITVSRLEEILFWNEYYKKNWQRLYEENPTKFEKYHGPAILFNFSLLSYLQKSVFKQEVNSVIENLKSRDKNDSSI